MPVPLDLASFIRRAQGPSVAGVLDFWRQAPSVDFYVKSFNFKILAWSEKQYHCGPNKIYLPFWVL